MRHHNYQTIASVTKKFCQKLNVPVPTREEHEANLEAARDKMEPSSHMMMQLHWEFDSFWEMGRKPYYLLYPSLIPMLSKLKLDRVTGEAITLPHELKSLLIRFPDGYGEVRSVWMFERLMHKVCGGTEVGRGMVLGIDHGETEATAQQPVYLIRAFPLTEGIPIEESLEALPSSWTASEGKQLDPLEIVNAVRVACTVCLLGSDSEVVAPEVLSKDERKVTQDNLDALVDKAKRRGKLGWSLGKQLETVPHYRRPHPALVWTGKGRKMPKVVMRSGAIVHRNVVEKIPTGYGADES